MGDSGLIPKDRVVAPHQTHPVIGVLLNDSKTIYLRSRKTNHEKAAKAKPEFLLYDKDKHTIWAIPVSPILYRFAWSTNARCSANDVRTIHMDVSALCSFSMVL